MRIVTIFFFIILTSCTTTVGTVIITGQARAPIEPSEVTLFLSAPSQQYEAIALIEVSCEAGSNRQAAQDRVINELRLRAARIGANGLILTTTGTYAGVTSGAVVAGTLITSTSRRVSTQAIAIYVVREYPTIQECPAVYSERSATHPVFGTISFATDSIWQIGSQIWSDAVTTTSCQKVVFYGGRTGNFNADCRSNPDFPGDLFSWYAVVRFAGFLCPYPWRVPTQQDFANLDRELGGDGRRVQYNRNLVNRYLNDWGAVYGGFVNSRGVQARRNAAMYWSKTEANATNAISLDIRTAEVRSQFPFNKGSGLSLRCVRNN